MSTYRIQAGAFLRLAAIAATSAEGDPAEILAIVQGAELEEAEHHPGDQESEAMPAQGGPMAPAKPEE